MRCSQKLADSSSLEEIHDDRHPSMPRLALHDSGCCCTAMLTYLPHRIEASSDLSVQLPVSILLLCFPQLSEGTLFSTLDRFKSILPSVLQPNQPCLVMPRSQIRNAVRRSVRKAKPVPSGRQGEGGTPPEEDKGDENYQCGEYWFCVRLFVQVLLSVC